MLGVLATFVTTILGSQGAISAALGVLFSTAYQVYFFTRTGQTLGAKVMGIKVVDADGNPLSVDLALIRVVGSYVSSALLGLGYLLMLWDGNKQTLHDKMAGSWSSRSQPRARPRARSTAAPTDQVSIVHSIHDAG